MATFPGAQPNRTGTPRGMRTKQNLQGGTVAAQILIAGTTLTVSFNPSTRGYTAPGEIEVGPFLGPYERMGYTGVTTSTFTGITHGLDGTAAAQHEIGEYVAQAPAAEDFNDPADELIAGLTKLGTGASTPVANTSLVGNGTGTSTWANVLNTTTGTIPQKGSGYALTDSGIVQGATKISISDGHVMEVSRQDTTNIATERDMLTGTFDYRYTGGVYSDIRGTPIVGSSLYGASGAAAVGTVGTISANMQVINSGHASNEFVALYGMLRANRTLTGTASQGRYWGQDLKLMGPGSAQSQADLLVGLTVLTNNHNSGAVTNGAFGAVFTALPGVDDFPTETTWPLDAMVAITGYSGVPANITTAYDADKTSAAFAGLKIGGWASGWQFDATKRASRFGTGLHIIDYDTQGILIGHSNWAGTAPALVIRNEAIPMLWYEVNTSDAVTAALRWVYDSGVYRVDQATDGGFTFSTFRTVQAVDTTGGMIVGGGTAITQSGYKLQVDGPLHLKSDTAAQLRITKADNLRPFTVDHGGNDITFNKGTGSIGSGNYQRFTFLTIGQLDANNPDYNGMAYYGHVVTDAGTGRQPFLGMYAHSSTATSPTDYEFLFSTNAFGTMPASVAFAASNVTGSYIRFGFGAGVPTSPEVLRLSYNSAQGNMAFNSASPTYGGGIGVIFIANRNTAPTSNPTGGILLYAESGSLKARGSSGTITTVAPA